MISSRHNPKIQAVRELLNRAQERQAAGEFVVEGVRLAEEAVQAGWSPRQVFFCDGLSARGQNLIHSLQTTQAAMEQVTPEVMAYLSDTETSQGVLAVYPRKELAIPTDPTFILAVDAVRDPGNLGTLLRTALAAGVQAVAIMPGSADPFSPKVVRSAMGAHFRLPVVSLQWDELQSLANHPRDGKGLSTYLAASGQGLSLWQVDWREPFILIVSNEAEGATPDAQRTARQVVHIPMPGGFESLNAAVAGSILMFEAVRQRNASPG